VNGTGWVRIEPMILHPVAFEALSDLNRGVKRDAQHQPFAEQCQQQIYQVPPSFAFCSSCRICLCLSFCFRLTRVIQLRIIALVISFPTHARRNGTDD
jgi:hypothetical protein